MAISSSTGAGAPGKSYPHPFPFDAPPPIVAGLVQHALLPASAQVQILSIIDAAGSACIGEIVTELPGHPDPVGAVMALIAAGVLVADVRGVVDANTLVRRAGIDPDPAPAGGAGKMPNPSNGPNDASVEEAIGLERLAIIPFSAEVVVGSGDARRGFARMAALRRPGIYILMNATSAYVGVGGDVGSRIAGGQQPIERIDTIIALTDANNSLTPEEAKVAERIVWSRLIASRERSLVNGVPDGAPVDAQRYSELDAFVAQACLALRHSGILFTTGSARAVLAGPRAEPGRMLPLRPLNDIPDGEVLELGFGGGLMAMAARQADDRWVLLQGSDVRPETVASANASASFLRSAWLHAGLLTASPDGRNYVAKRDLTFQSGSAVAQFCTGAKGRGLAGWHPIDAGDGHDPDMPVLIAR